MKGWNDEERFNPWGVGGDAIYDDWSVLTSCGLLVGHLKCGNRGLRLCHVHARRTPFTIAKDNHAHRRPALFGASGHERPGRGHGNLSISVVHGKIPWRRHGLIHDFLEPSWTNCAGRARRRSIS